MRSNNITCKEVIKLWELQTTKWKRDYVWAIYVIEIFLADGRVLADLKRN